MQIVTEDVIKQKQEAIEGHFQKFVEAINNMNKRIDDALRDKQKKVSIGAEFLTQFKTNIEIDTNSTLGMVSSDKIQYAKMWFESKQRDIETLKQISTESQKSFIQTLDEQIQACRKEIELMEKV
jgi:hypothetical protein